MGARKTQHLRRRFILTLVNRTQRHDFSPLLLWLIESWINCRCGPPYLQLRRFLGKIEAAWPILRGVATCLATGHAAGTAASLAARGNSKVRNLNIQALQQFLKEQQAILSTASD